MIPKIDRANKMIRNYDIDQLVDRYIEIVEEVNDNIIVSKRRVKQYVDSCIDDYSYGPFEGDGSNYDYDLTIKENVELMIREQDKYACNYPDWWLDCGDSPEDLYEMGKQLKLFKELKED